MYIDDVKNSLLWRVTWCFLCAHSQDESLCLGLLTVSNGHEPTAR